MMTDKKLAWQREYQKLFRVKERARKYSKEYSQRPEVKERKSEYDKERWKKLRGDVGVPERMKFMQNSRNQLNRLLVLAAYGGKCACCGEEHPSFLSMDHINGGGKKDRSKYGSVQTWYRRALEEHPADLRVLCHNCNLARAFYGECPHQQERGVTND
jgi:hypothetical protein